MKRNIVLKIIIIVLLLGFGSQLSRFNVVVQALDDIRSIRNETGDPRNDRNEENRDTDTPRENRDTQTPRDRESIICDPKFGGDPSKCITPTEIPPTPTRKVEPTPTPTPPQEVPPTATPTPGPQGGPGPTSTPTGGPSEEGKAEEGKGGPGEALGEKIGEVKALAITSGESKTEFVFLLAGIICIFSGFRLIRPSRRI